MTGKHCLHSCANYAYIVGWGWQVLTNYYFWNSNEISLENLSIFLIIYVQRFACFFVTLLSSVIWIVLGESSVTSWQSLCILSGLLMLFLVCCKVKACHGICHWCWNCLSWCQTMSAFYDWQGLVFVLLRQHFVTKCWSLTGH